MNLFELATANGPRIEEEYAALRSSLSLTHVEKIDRFADLIKSTGRLSVNMRLMVALRFLTFERHQNVYEWVTEQSELSGESCESLLRRALGEFCERRLAFDGVMDGGRDFRYAALNIGGPGTILFGEYCLVFGTALGESRNALAYVPGDSLRLYVRDGNVVDHLAIARDAAPHAQRHCVATLKHARQLDQVDECHWARMLCGRDYVEAIFAGASTPSDLEVVRMPKHDYDFLFDQAFLNLTVLGDDATRYRVSAFVMTLRLLKEKRIHLEILR